MMEERVSVYFYAEQNELAIVAWARRQSRWGR